ncbi:MAG: class I SAM-dependent methyltransferase [Lachnospiraceae bacterium]|nr:class I SAM-dependent methyltransferase [Lachnospiraceae bacterium]
MDQNETRKGMIYRHPWELSRTRMLIREWKPFVDSLGDAGPDTIKCVNVGAGDLFFDDEFIKTDNRIEVCAVDIGYEIGDGEVVTKGCRRLAKDIDDYTDIDHFDYSVMMDSLEYIPDDRGYIEKLASRVKSGGYMFFTLPAYKDLFSDHDRHVGNKRRYDREEAESFFSDIEDIEMIRSRYFYFSLYLIRRFQVRTGSKIDPDRKITTGWKYKETGFVSRLVTGLLNLDYKLGKHLPGLSLMIICRKK